MMSKDYLLLAIMKFNFPGFLLFEAPLAMYNGSVLGRF